MVRRSQGAKPTLAFKPARGIEGLDTEDTYRTRILVLMALVGLVLVTVCVNVTTPLVAKQSARQREFSLRLALGASHVRIFRQLLLESLLLVTMGAALAWLFALVATRALASWSEIGKRSRARWKCIAIYASGFRCDRLVFWARASV